MTNNRKNQFDPPDETNELNQEINNHDHEKVEQRKHIFYQEMANTADYCWGTQ